VTSSETEPAAAGQRIDKWLWQARFFKSRSLAAQTVSEGHLRINGQRAAKPAQTVRVGDTLTFPQARRIRVVRVRHLANRRGPAAEAETLYDDLTEPAPAEDPGKQAHGRPDRGARRAARRLKQGPLE